MLKGSLDVHQRQLTCWVKMPPRIGPAMFDIANMEVMIPV